MRAQRRQFGFTLVELMAASVITAFLAMVAVGGMISITSARNSLDEVTKVMDELRYASDLLRLDLANVHRNTQEMLFEGLLEDSGAMAMPRLRFRAIGTSKARPAQPEGDLYEIEYLFFEGQDGKTQLARRVCPVVGIEEAADQTAGGMLTKISDQISFFGVRFFDGTAWTTIWPAEQQLLPTLIEVSLASRVVEKNGKEKIYAKQVILTFPRIGDQTATTEEETEEEDTSLEIEFTDPEAGM
jgi:prepilin-type N-terminal cleavage/methylation domain-containing protein